MSTKTRKSKNSSSNNKRSNNPQAPNQELLPITRKPSHGFTKPSSLRKKSLTHRAWHEDKPVWRNLNAPRVGSPIQLSRPTSANQLLRIMVMGIRTQLTVGACMVSTCFHITLIRTVSRTIRDIRRLSLLQSWSTIHLQHREGSRSASHRGSVRMSTSRRNIR